MAKEIDIISKSDYINYLKFKIKTIVPSVVNQINYEKAEPGFVLTNEADETFRLYLECGLCGHIADEPLACNICLRNYCRSCIRILIDAKKLVEDKTNFEEVEVVGQKMVCFSRCIIGKVILYMNPEVNKLEGRIFSCPNEKCEFKGKWEQMPGHRGTCMEKDENFRVNKTYWPYVYTQKEEIEYQVQKEFYMFLERQMIEAYQIQRTAELSAESWETPIAKESTLESGSTRREEGVIDIIDEVLEEEIKNRQDVKKAVVYGQESRAPTEFESDSEDEELVRKLPEKLRHVKFAEFSKVSPQTEKSGESSSSMAKRVRSKRQKNRSRKRQRSEIVEVLESRARPVRIHEEDNLRIKPKIEQLKKDNLSIIAIDVEKMTVKGHFAKNVDIACWIAITDMEGKILLNTLIRIPATAIKNTCEEFHGVNKKMIKNGMSFNMIRRIMFDYCKKADRIIMASPEGDFESLRIPPEDYNLLIPKI